MIVGLTGWEGFIGSHLRRVLPDPLLFQGDLKDLDSVQDFVRRCDRVYHLAGLNREKPGGIVANNLVATGNLILSAILQNSQPETVFLSSTQVEWNPHSEYGFAKSIEEEIVKKTQRWCIYRVPNVYGPGGKPFYNSVVATFTYQLAHGQAVAIEDPSVTREFIFIDDLVDALTRPRFPGYLHPEGERLSIGQIYDYLTSKLGQHPKLKKCLDYYLQENGHV
jgi:UDP-2-acetamido-2,6-beta-L-arabino-hexul-4-ose reductase